MKLLINKIALYLLIVALPFLVWGCKYIDPCQQKEILRNTSQDNVVDFVVIEKNCGATTSISTFIFIVPKGKPIDKFNPVFDADHIEDLEVDWVAPKQMTIAYKKARIFSYTNFWQSRDVEGFNYAVFIREYQK